MTDPTDVVIIDAVVVGAGFAGMYALQRLRDDLGLEVRAFERGSDVGGTWFWNRYPGARCDVESMFYSYSFSEELEQEWNWTERYPTQPEILAYAGHVADRFDLRPNISFGTSIVRAEFDESIACWAVHTDRAESVHARFLIGAVGCLSAAQIPDIPGIDTFGGEILHTGQWPADGYSFEGKGVAVIGTGSSGVQAIPVIAREARHLTVFQRTPHYVIPAGNGPLQSAEVAGVKSGYRSLRDACKVSHAGTVVPPPVGSAITLDEEGRRRELDRRWLIGGAGIMSTFNDTSVNLEANAILAGYVREQIAVVVNSPETAAHLTPRDYPIGAKRICLGDDYYATYNRDDVTLVDVREVPITGVTSSGVVAGGIEHEVDVIVFATGYDAMTGALTGMNISGVDGVSLRDAWAAGPRTYLGIASAGFPNLFMITGPGSPSVLANVIVSIEQHVDWMCDLVAHLRERDLNRVEADPDAQDRWVEHVNEIALPTMYMKASNWYLGANIPGKARVFMPYAGGMGRYRRICDEVATDGYRGFNLATVARPASARVQA